MLNDPLLLPEILIILLIFILLVIAYINLRSLRTLSDYSTLHSYPRISVLIPARNEEGKIGHCVESLLKQDYSNYEVIVLNDNSTDHTGEILDTLKRNNDRLQIITGKPLPYDWLGKHWACHQLYQAANGEYLMFTDADTVHTPQTLTNALAAMHDEKADMISIIPRHILKSLPEQLIMPMFALGVFAVVPLLSRFRPRSVNMVSSSGKLMMFSRKAYEACGGFEGIRQNVLDDLELPQRIREAGLRYRLFDGTNNVSCRMYHNYKEVYEGLTKNTFAAFSYNIPLNILTWICLLFMAWEPVVTLAVYKIPQYPPTLAHGLALISVIGLLLLWTVYYQRFKFPLYMAVLYPFSIMSMAAVSIASMTLTLSGRTKWKDRKLPTRKIY